MKEEYRGCSYATTEESKELGYTVIILYYKTEEKLENGKSLYGVMIKSKCIAYPLVPKYYEKREYQEIAKIGTIEKSADELIEKLKRLQVTPITLKEVMEDMKV